LICASFAARAAAKDGEAANGSLHKLGMDYLYAALHVTAIRYAAEKRYLAESIAELREIERQSRRRLISWRHVLERRSNRPRQWRRSNPSSGEHDRVAAAIAPAIDH
jgi:hypothetical protein